MSYASTAFLTMRNLPYDRLKDLCENHEKFSSSKPEVQSLLCELLSRGQEQEPICQERLVDRKVSEIVRTIACKAIQSGREIDGKTVLSLAGRAVSVANADQTMAIAESISSFFLLPEVQSLVSERLSRGQEKELICQELLMNEKVSEIVRAILCKSVPRGMAINQKAALSMVCAKVSAASSDQMLAIAETISSALLEPQLQGTVYGRLSGDQEKEPICGEPLDKEIDELIHHVTFKATLNLKERIEKAVLSVAIRIVSETDPDQPMEISENISSFLLLETMEECVSQVEELERWVKEDGSRSEAAQIILSFLTNPSCCSLRLWGQGLTSLPRFVAKKRFCGLRFFYLGNNKLKKFPDLSALPALEHLSLTNNEITAVSVDAEGIGLIQDLYLNSNQITVLPNDLTAFRSLRGVTFARNQIQDIPEKVSFPNSLEMLNLEGNQISAIRGDLEGLKSVKRLYLGSNPIRKLPGNFKGLEGLEFLSLSGNKIPERPEKIEGLGGVKTLYLWMGSPPSIEFLRAWGLRSLETLHAIEEGETVQEN